MFCDDPKIGFYERRSDGSFVWYPFGPMFNGVPQTADQLQRRGFVIADLIIICIAIPSLSFMPLVIKYLFNLVPISLASIPQLPFVILIAFAINARRYWPVFTTHKSMWTNDSPFDRGYDVGRVRAWPIIVCFTVAFLVSMLMAIYFNATFYGPKRWYYFEGVVSGSMIVAFFLAMRFYYWWKAARAREKRR